MCDKWFQCEIPFKWFKELFKQDQSALRLSIKLVRRYATLMSFKSFDNDFLAKRWIKMKAVIENKLCNKNS